MRKLNKQERREFWPNGFSGATALAVKEKIKAKLVNAVSAALEDDESAIFFELDAIISENVVLALKQFCEGAEWSRQWETATPGQIQICDLDGAPDFELIVDLDKVLGGMFEGGHYEEGYLEGWAAWLEAAAAKIRSAPKG